jgi:Spy/CpxP family protein refolding chaperone
MSKKFILAGGAAIFVGWAVLFASAVPGMAFGGRHGGGHGPEFMLWKLDRMLGTIDASEGQRAEVEGIVEAAMTEIRELRPRKAELHESVVAALTGAEVDRAELEAIRAEHSARIDAVSERVAQAIGDAASVLTQEQRLALADLVEERMQRRGWRH